MDRKGAAIFGLGLAARLAHVAAIRDSALVLHPSIDPGAYDARAREILAGDWVGRGVSFQDPLYPYLLAAAKALTGGTLLGPYVVHAAVGALASYLLYRVGRRYASEAAGAIAGFAAAVYAPFLYLDGLLEKNAFTIAALLAALLVFPPAGRSAPGRSLAAGALLGAGALLRGNFLLLAPVLAAVAAWRRRGAWPARLAAGALFLAGVALPIAPFTLRNRIAGGEWVLTTAQAGTAFYLGNNPENTSGGIHRVSFNRQVPEFEADDWKREAERRSGRVLTRAEVSSFWFRAALAHIASDPGAWLRVVARRAELLLHRYEVPDNTSMLHVEELSPVVRWNPFRFATLAPLGLVGVALGLRRWRERAPLFAAFGVYAGTLLFFPISDRFRAPLAALWLLGAAEAALALLEAARSRRWKRLGALALGVAAAAAVVNHDFALQPADSNLREENARLKAAHDEAVAWINAKKWDRAEAVLERAMADPWLATKARLQLDLALVRWHGRRDPSAAAIAERSIAALLKAGESMPDGYRLWAEIQEAQGKPSVAKYWRGRVETADSQNWNELEVRAREAADRGEVERATGILDEIVFADRIRPAAVVPAQAYALLARLQLASGNRPRAVETARALVRRGGALPDDLAPLLGG